MTPRAPLDGLTAVVTGAGQGIGAATAHRLARDGATVAVVDLSEEKAASVANAIVAAGLRAIPVACDVGDEDSVEAAAAHITAEAGSISILVNNAGLIADDLLFRMSADAWDSVLRVHLRGSFLWARAAQRSMVAQRWGRIVNVSSVSALGSRGQANYSAAKAGVQGFTRTLAIELGPFNVTANAVAPGFIDTAMTRQVADRSRVSFEELTAASAAAIPLRRVGQPDEVAGVVSFLVGPDASYVSGEVVYVAGGPRP